MGSRLRKLGWLKKKTHTNKKVAPPTTRGQSWWHLVVVSVNKLIKIWQRQTFTTCFWFWTQVSVANPLYKSHLNRNTSKSLLNLCWSRRFLSLWHLTPGQRAPWPGRAASLWGWCPGCWPAAPSSWRRCSDARPDGETSRFPPAPAPCWSHGPSLRGRGSTMVEDHKQFPFDCLGRYVRGGCQRCVTGLLSNQRWSYCVTPHYIFYSGHVKHCFTGFGWKCLFIPNISWQMLSLSSGSLNWVVVLDNCVASLQSDWLNPFLLLIWTYLSRPPSPVILSDTSDPASSVECVHLVCHLPGKCLSLVELCTVSAWAHTNEAVYLFIKMETDLKVQYLFVRLNQRGLWGSNLFGVHLKKRGSQSFLIGLISRWIILAVLPSCFFYSSILTLNTDSLLSKETQPAFVNRLCLSVGEVMHSSDWCLLRRFNCSVVLSDFVANFAYHLFLVHITSSYFTLLTSECYFHLLPSTFG